MKKFGSTLLNFWKKHRIWSIVIVISILGVTYYTYGKVTSTTGVTSYILSTVKKDTIVSTITTTGQVSASSLVSLKAKASGDLVYLGVSSGQEVKKGDLVAKFDATNALKSVRDAESSLESSKISMEKLIAPADALTLTQSENSLTQAKQSLSNAQENLTQGYDNAFNSISNAFLDLPSLMQGFDGVLHNSELRSFSQNVYAYADAIISFKSEANQYRDDVISKFDKAKSAYDQNFIDFKNITRYSDSAKIESLLNETYLTVKLISDSVKSMNNLIDLYKDVLTEQKMNISTVVSSHIGNLNSYTSKTNTHLGNLLSSTNSIGNNKDAIINAQNSLDEKTQSLQKVKDGADQLDIKSAQLSLTQKENALIDAQNNLSDYYIYAPFDGTIASVAVTKYDTINSGTAIATLVTKQQLAQVSFNEVDAAKIKLGQKATMTFDAIEGLVMTGSVTEMDTVGTVSQGVVTYKANITFDIVDDRIKPGMSVSASIITDVKQDVLTVANGAVKTSSNGNYVEILAGLTKVSVTGQGVVSEESPQQKEIVIGISNDTLTEVISGLKEGEQVVSRTIKPTTTASAVTSATSLLGGGGNRNSATTRVIGR